MRQIKINSTVGNEILTAQNVKDYVRIDTASDDNIISAMITQARIWCENYISRYIVSKNRTYYLPTTNGVFDLPFGPVSSISTVNVNGTDTTAFETLGLDNETIELDGGGADRVCGDWGEGDRRPVAGKRGARLVVGAALERDPRRPVGMGSVACRP